MVIESNAEGEGLECVSPKNNNGKKGMQELKAGEKIENNQEKYYNHMGNIKKELAWITDVISGFSSNQSEGHSNENILCC